MNQPPLEVWLETLAIDAFRVFGSDPTTWPDTVQFNRSGLTDVNIRGIWSLEDRFEFHNVPFKSLDPASREDIPTSPESTGGSV